MYVTVHCVLASVHATSQFNTPFQGVRIHVACSMHSTLRARIYAVCFCVYIYVVCVCDGVTVAGRNHYVPMSYPSVKSECS